MLPALCQNSMTCSHLRSEIRSNDFSDQFEGKCNITASLNTSGMTTPALYTVLKIPNPHDNVQSQQTI